MLASELLAGYHGGNFDVTMESNDIDPIAFIQEACIEFVTESTALVQQYYTADIIGQGQVITEGASPEVIMEANSESLWSKFKELIKKLIKKLREWIKKVKAWFKKKFSKKKVDETKKTIEKAAKTMDKTEPIKISGPTTATALPDKGAPVNYLQMTLVRYDIEAGDECCNKMYAAINDILMDFSDGIVGDKTIGTSSAGYTTTSLETNIAKKKFKEKIGVDADKVSHEIATAYGAANPTSKDVAITLDLVSDAVGVCEAADKSIEVITDNMEQFCKKMEHLVETSKNQGKMNPDAANGYTVLAQTFQYMSQLMATISNCSINVWTKVRTQAQSVIDAANNALKNGGYVEDRTLVKEGTEPDKSDPPEDPEDDGEDVVTEGANIDIIKKYIDGARGHLETMRKANKLVKKQDFKGAKSQFESAKKGLKKVYDDLVDASEEKTITNLTGIPATVVSSVIVLFDEILTAPLATAADVISAHAIGSLTSTKKSAIGIGDVVKANQDTSGNRNINLTFILSKINACINTCDKQIKACDKMMKKGVSESTIWDQAADYL